MMFRCALKWIFVCLMLMAGFTYAGGVPDDARRHVVRGQTAAEMARIPADYETAIEEFDKARNLAPDWPDVYWNLADAQEKAGKFQDAAESLKRYLQLFPAAPQAPEIRDRIARLEFKAEQVITDEAALEIFSSLGNQDLWVLRGVSPGSDPSRFAVKILGRKGRRILMSYYAGMDGGGWQSFQAEPNGKAINLQLIEKRCDRETQEDGCPVINMVNMEIISRRHVKVYHKQMTSGVGGVIPPSVHEYIYAFEKR